MSWRKGKRSNKAIGSSHFGDKARVSHSHGLLFHPAFRRVHRSHFRSVDSRDIPSLAQGKCGVVSEVFLRSDRFAKSRELPAERRKLEEWRNMYQPRTSSHAFIPEANPRRELPGYRLVSRLISMRLNPLLPRLRVLYYLKRTENSAAWQQLSEI